MVILCFLLVGKVGFEEGTRRGGASWVAKIILFGAVVKGVRGDASQYMDNTAGVLYEAMPRNTWTILLGGLYEAEPRSTGHVGFCCLICFFSGIWGG